MDEGGKHFCSASIPVTLGPHDLGDRTLLLLEEHHEVAPREAFQGL